ncbi:MAG: lipoate--protein ligase family protein [Planctomycetota bacterium]
MLVDPPAAGDWNLAVDEALLEDTARLWLRFYAWDPPTISLGYFQAAADFAGEARPLVRRPTGGGAILHADELTYCLAVGEDLLPPGPGSYGLVNRALAAALAELGVDVSPPRPGPRSGSPWCFADPVGIDLVDRHGRKVVGSAQRRRLGRVLCHGSLLLGRVDDGPQIGALRELGLRGEDRLPEVLAGRIAAALGRGWRRADGLPGEVAARARAIRAERYADPAWTLRR